MSNLRYDPVPGWLVSPHIGGGIGAVYLDSSLRVPGFGQTIAGTDWLFGYQAIAGMRYSINRLMAVDLDYRYLATTTAHFRTGPDFVDSGVAAPNLRVQTMALPGEWEFRNLILRNLSGSRT